MDPAGGTARNRVVAVGARSLGVTGHPALGAPAAMPADGESADGGGGWFTDTALAPAAGLLRRLLHGLLCHLSRQVLRRLLRQTRPCAGRSHRPPHLNGCDWKR
ncbi:hypothetical protein GCM10010129_73060 [Streptomyces fumigatiscleroticus]|nr:hypothetical protein GCM10010129_73060 [Streptomyces fumigatiscleroticus]